MRRMFLASILVLPALLALLPGCGGNNPTSPNPGPTRTSTSTFTVTPTGTLVPTSTSTRTFTPVICSAVTFGYPLVGSSPDGSGGYVEAGKYELSEAGFVTGISLYLAQASGQVRAALYSDFAGSPNQLLAESSPQAAQAGWNLMDIIDTPVSAGTYWLAFQVQSGSSARFDPGASGSSAYLPSAFGTFPANFPPHNKENHQWSLVALYCPFGSRPTNTPTMTDTFTVTDTPTRTPTETPTLTASSSPTITRTFTPEPPLCSPYSTFGKTTLGTGLPMPAGSVAASKATLTKVARVTQLSFWFGSNGNQRLQGFILADAEGYPGGSIVQSQVLEVSDSHVGWLTFDVPDTLLYPGDYWLGVQAEVGGAGRGSPGGSAVLVYPTTFGTLPDLSSASLFAGTGSIYAEYCPAEPGTYPTFTRTITPTPTLSPTATATYPCAPNAVGYGSVGGSIAYANNYLFASRVDLPESGRVLTLRVYGEPQGTGELSVGVYADAGGSPGSLLTGTSAYSVAGFEGWYGVPIPQTILPAGSYYLALYGTGFTARTESIGGETWFGSDLSLPTLPDYFPVEMTTGDTFSLELLYCPEAFVGSPTPTETSTETETPSPTSTPTPNLSWTATRTPTPTATPYCAQTPLADLIVNMNGAPVIGDTTEGEDDYAQGGFGAGAQDDLYVLTLSAPQSLHLTLCGSSFDTTLYVRSSCGDTLSTLAFNDDFPGCGTRSRIETTLGAGTYYVIVDGYSEGDAGAYTLSLTDGIPTPTPTEDPNVTDDDFDNWTENDGDCDDTRPDVNPGYPEACDGVDNDCNGQIDEIEPCWTPTETETPTVTETPDPNTTDDDFDGWAENGGDCDDTRNTVYPGAFEACDGLDNDCDTAVDDNCQDTPTQTPTLSPTLSPTPSPTFGPLTQVFYEPFENNNQGWTLGTTWGIGPATTSSGEESGSPDPGTDMSPGPDNGVAGVMIGGNAPTFVHAYYFLESPPIDTTGAPSLTLRFWRWLNSDYDPYMHNKVEVWDGSTWITIWVTEGVPAILDSEWTRQQFDVSAYSNPAFRVRFGYDVTNSSVYTISSWNIDEVEVGY